MPETEGIVKDYLKEIQKIHKKGDAREESYYPALKVFLEKLGDLNKKRTDITILPRSIEGNNPDFRIWDGRQKVTGYVEAKDPSVTDLDTIERSEQLKRYRNTFHNLILTNFHEFRFYRAGVLMDTVFIARRNILLDMGKIVVENEAEFLEAMERFFDYSMPAINSPKALAVELAKRTKFLKDDIIGHEIGNNETIMAFYGAFREYLVPDLSEADFVNLYSQTIAYGIFAARTRSGGGIHPEKRLREDSENDRHTPRYLQIHFS